MAGLYCAAGILPARAQTPALAIPNPSPAIAELFGESVGVVGSGLWVGDPQDSTRAQYSGAVYLFNSAGTLMQTFTNPALGNGYFFGWSVAAVGSEAILIGAPLGAFPGASAPGAAYLFHTNGTLLRTFLRPTTQAGAHFGIAVAALGGDRVLIGADGDDRVGPDAGAAYLFGVNGTLLATFTNPAPQNFELFGSSLTVLGSDRVVIGAPNTPGSAYLFRTNGALLAKFNNPIPQSGGSFGRTLAALGSDAIAIGAPAANIMAAGGGVVYLFRTNGVLRGPALENPDVTANDNFGLALAAVGTNQLLVGSFHQAAGQNAGAAYLFSADGTPLMKISNPETNGAAFFGTALAAISPKRVLIGARETDPAGAAYVFDLRPSLRILKTATNTVAVSWPSAWSGWTLQESVDLEGDSWGNSSTPMSDDGVTKVIVVDPPTGRRNFRLSQP